MKDGRVIDFDIGNSNIVPLDEKTQMLIKRIERHSEFKSGDSFAAWEDYNTRALFADYVSPIDLGLREAIRKSARYAPMLAVKVKYFDDIVFTDLQKACFEYEYNKGRATGLEEVTKGVYTLATDYDDLRAMKLYLEMHGLQGGGIDGEENIEDTGLTIITKGDAERLD